jgi:hypothetical protein
MKGYGLKNAIISFLLSLFFLYIARKIYLDYSWFLIIYIYVVGLLMGHTTTNTVKPEKEVEVPEKLETIDKFLIIPMVGGIEFATYGFIIFILDIFFNFLPTI